MVIPEKASITSPTVDTTTAIDLTMTGMDTPTRPGVLRLPGPRVPPAAILSEGGLATTPREKGRMEQKSHLAVAAMPPQGRFKFQLMLPAITTPTAGRQRKSTTFLATEKKKTTPLANRSRRTTITEKPPPPSTEGGGT